MAKKLYVGNLSWGTTNETLTEHFSPFGEIEEAFVLTFHDTGRSRGFGFVTFVNDEDADKAIEATNEKEFDGREIKVNVAQPKED